MQNDLVSVAIREETVFLSGQGTGNERNAWGSHEQTDPYAHELLFSPLNTVTITFPLGTPLRKKQDATKKSI